MGVRQSTRFGESKPDLIFWDVQMPEDGWIRSSADHRRGIYAGCCVRHCSHDQVVQFRPSKSMRLITCSKPVIEERFVKALVRAKSRIHSSVAADSKPSDHRAA